MKPNPIPIAKGICSPSCPVKIWYWRTVVSTKCLHQHEMSASFFWGGKTEYNELKWFITTRRALILTYSWRLHIQFPQIIIDSSRLQCQWEAMLLATLNKADKFLSHLQKGNTKKFSVSADVVETSIFRTQALCNFVKAAYWGSAWAWNGIRDEVIHSVGWD